MALLITLLFLFSSVQVFSCNELDCNSLLSFYEHITSPLPAIPVNCCQWEGITCNSESRVSHLSLARKGLTGTITPFLGNLSYLSHINLSHNHFFGSLPVTLFRTLHYLESLDLSFNLLSGWLADYALPASIQFIDLSSNRFTGLIDSKYFFRHALNLVSFNVSNNSFTGSLPSSLCITSNLVKILDFSVNKFSGNISQGIGRCSKLEVFRAGQNSLLGQIPYDLYNVKTLREISIPSSNLAGPLNNSIAFLSNISIIDLHENELTGEIPTDIGLLSNLKKLILYSNRFNGSVPPSLMNCSNLKILLLRNNSLGGEISSLDFSKLQKLEVIDVGNNSFGGNIPVTLCLCTSLTAVQFAYNQLKGQIPACMAQLKSLSHLSLADNNLFNILGSFMTLMKCGNLSVLVLAGCFHDEQVPDHVSLQCQNAFQNLQLLSIAQNQLKGEMPSWIGKLKKLKVLNLSYNQITGNIPKWLGSLPSLFHLDLTQNHLRGELPRELGRLKAMMSDETDSQLSNNILALPFLLHGLQYNRLSNLPSGIHVGNNSLSGNIPVELGQLPLLCHINLNHNNFSGSIPSELSHLENLEVLDMSDNNLSGKIPQSLTILHFLSFFNVENNDLEGEIPKGGQFDTFPATSFHGNPKLFGYVLHRSSPNRSQLEILPPIARAKDSEISHYALPFGLGYFVGFLVIIFSLLFKRSCKCIS